MLNPEIGFGPEARDLLAKDTHEHTIRIAPPLVIQLDAVDWASEIFARVLKD